jgi:hypothetical protein
MVVVINTKVNCAFICKVMYNYVMKEQSDQILDVDKSLSVSEIKHGLVEVYKPVNIGSGGESLVYVPTRGKESMEGIKSVIKIRKESLVQCIKWQLKNPDVPLEAYDTTGHDHFETYSTARKADLSELRDYFGRQAVPAERHVYMRVPVTEDILQQCFYDAGEDVDEIDFNGIKESFATVSIQTFQDGILNGKEYLNIESDQGIENELNESEYESSVGGLVFNLNSVDLSHEINTTLDACEALSVLLERCNTDETIKKLLLSFIKNAVDYSRDTGKILDLNSGNVLINDSESPKLVLVDALISKNIHMDMNSLPKVWKTIDILSQDGPRVYHVLNYIRAINIICYKLTGELAINLFDEASSLDEVSAANIRLLRKQVKKQNPFLGWLYALMQEEKEG